MKPIKFKRGELYSVINAMAVTAINRRLQKKFREANIDITIEQWSILYHLWKQDGLTQQDLCNKTNRDKPSITRLINNLEKQELVERNNSTIDKRKNHIHLTKKAYQLQEISVDVANETMDEALVGIAKQDIQVVKNVLQKVYDNLTM